MKKEISEEKVIKTAISVDLIDILLNGIVTLLSGSVVMLAETLQGVSDLVVDSLAYIGMKRSKRMPTKKYPLGFGRELYIWSLFASLVMFWGLAGLSFYFGFKRFINPEQINYIFLAYAILIISFFTNAYSFSLGCRRILQEKPIWKVKQAFVQSTFLETKITFISDLTGSLAALLGLISLFLFEKTSHLWFDGLGAMMIGLFMALFSIWLFRNIRDFIIGVSIDDETKNLIKKAVLEIEGIEDLLDLKAVVIGSNRLLINVEIHVRSGLVTEEIESLIDRVKANIKLKVPSSYHIQIELETP